MVREKGQGICRSPDTFGKKVGDSNHRHATLGEIVERLKVPLILHICGKTLDRMDYIAQNGMAMFHFDSKNDPQKAMDIVDGRIGLVGNINNPETLYARGPEEVRAEVFRCLDAGVNMIAPECAVPLATRLENILEIRNAVIDWCEEHY